MSDPLAFTGRAPNASPFFEDVRRPGREGSPTRASSTPPGPTGSPRPPRARALAEAIADMAGMTDETDTEEVWAEVRRGIDEARPHRKLFEGMD